MAERDVELALDAAQQALDLLGRRTEALSQPLAELGEQGDAGLGDPARGGGAVNPVDRRDPLESETFKVVVAQSVALPAAERTDRLLEGGHEVAPVTALDELQLGIGRDGVGERPLPP